MSDHSVIERIAYPGLPTSQLYSHAVVVGDLIHTAGIVAIDSDGNTVGVGDVRAQTTAVIEHIETILEQAGSSLDNVFMSQIFLSDLKEYAAMNEVYLKYFARSCPARFCVGAALVKRDWLVEIAVSARRVGPA